MDQLDPATARFQPHATPSPSFDRLQLVLENEVRGFHVVYREIYGNYMGIIVIYGIFYGYSMDNIVATPYFLHGKCM